MLSLLKSLYRLVKATNVKGARASYKLFCADTETALEKTGGH